eukprot:8458975-Pyramimonas_sp.AAC.1
MFHGSPKLYTTFTDEGLNVCLRSLAQFAHRASLEIRIFTMFDIQGRLGLNHGAGNGAADGRMLDWTG